MYLSSKRLAVLALPILLSACALPASFTIATLAADGISYATSGKSVTDHAISAVAKEDCAMWRALQDRPICRDREGSATMVAAAPAAGGSMAPEAATTEPYDEFEVTAAAFAALTVAEESEVPAAVQEVAPAAGGFPVPETATTEPQAVTALAANGTTAMAAIKPEPLPAMIDTPAPTAVPADRETATEPVQLAILAPSLPKMEAEPKFGRFVVLGSYLKESRARDIMKRAHDFAPRIVRVRVHGKLFYRVVSGPYARSSIATMRRTLIGEGFRGAWTTTLCQNAPCAGPHARRRSRP